MPVQKNTAMRRFLWSIVLSVGAGSAMAEDAWVHGSWVNLRSAPSTSAPIKAQLTTNTKIAVTARTGDWCAARAVAPALDGFVHCSFIGATPLKLAEAKDNPARLFWIAPSVGRLVAYGALLRAGDEYKRMYAALQPGETARISPLPEFDAAKRLMNVGIVPKVESELNRGAPVDPEQMEYYRLLKPSAIKSSYFKQHGDVVLPSEADADGLAAVSRSSVSVTVTAPPVGFVARHEGPEISGISGFGDVGEAEIRFTPSVLMYSLLPNGLLSGDVLMAQKLVGAHDGYGESCGMQYTGKSIGSPTSGGYASLTVKPAAGFTRPPESMLLMASFVTAKPLAMKKLTIRSRAVRVPNVQRPANAEAPESALMAVTPKVVLHEVDFDGDKVADMLIWDAPSIGSMSGGFNLRRTWYLNIDGRWYAAGGMDDQECT